MARTAPGVAASRLIVWEAVADSASEPVKFVPSGMVTGHQTPAEVTPLMRSATASALAGKPMGGLVSGAATLLAGPLSSHRHRGVLEHGELARDLARTGGGQAEHGDERAHAEDRAQHGEHGPARALHDAGHRLGGGVAGGQPGPGRLGQAAGLR